MPALLLSLLPLLARVAPDLVGLAFGGQGQAVASRVEATLHEVFGTADPAAVATAAEADPAKVEALRVRLDAAAAEMRARLADLADARAGTVGLARAGSPIAWGSPVVSAIVVAAFAAVAVEVLFRYGVDSAVGQLIAGALIAKFGTVVDFWLGSSSGSSDRADQVTALLRQSLGAGERGDRARAVRP